MTEAELHDTFSYHQPSPEAVEDMERIRKTMRQAVMRVAARLPASRERSTFITLMQEASMMAIASIAIHGRAGEEGHRPLSEALHGAVGIHVNGRVHRWQGLITYADVVALWRMAEPERVNDPDPAAVDWKAVDGAAGTLYPQDGAIDIADVRTFTVDSLLMP